MCDYFLFQYLITYWIDKLIRNVWFRFFFLFVNMSLFLGLDMENHGGLHCVDWEMWGGIEFEMGNERVWSRWWIWPWKKLQTTGKSNAFLRLKLQSVLKSLTNLGDLFTGTVNFMSIYCFKNTFHYKVINHLLIGNCSSLDANLYVPSYLPLCFGLMMPSPHPSSIIFCVWLWISPLWDGQCFQYWPR